MPIPHNSKSFASQAYSEPRRKSPRLQNREEEGGKSSSGAYALQVGTNLHIETVLTTFIQS